MPCPSCSADVQEDARFCWSCGRPLGVAAADERRVVTVLFADIVGFTALAEGRDPELVKNLIDDCFARVAADITAFGGQVDKVIGDAIVALFGAPVAHEDDAERAVRAALKMQETAQSFALSSGAQVRMRVGVNTGEVLVGRFRADLEYTAMGDTVNIASRLQTMADPGTVLVGPATYRATRHAMRYESRGPLDLRGMSEAVEVWRAVEAIGLPGGRRPRRSSPLVGRDDEMEILECTLDRTVARGRAHLVLVLGDGGVGKTRLAEEVTHAAVARHGALILAGRCVPYGESNAWAPLADGLRGVLDVDLDASDDAASALAAELARLMGVAGDDAAIAAVAPGLLHLLGMEGELQGLEPAGARDEAARAYRALLQMLAVRQPVVVWLTDLHWADDVVRSLVDSMLSRLGRLPVLVLATARHELFDSWVPKAGRTNQVFVTLDPLSRGDARQLLTTLLGADVPDDLAEELLNRAEGNPFYLEELAASLRDGESHRLQLPDNVRGLVSARLDSLAFEERTLLEDASVLGRRGPTQGLVVMARELHGWTDIGPMVRRLDERDLLRVDQTMWQFRSNLVHDVAYNRLTKSDRARRHAGVASFLEGTGRSSAMVGPIAHHYLRAASLVGDIGPVDGVPDDVVDRALSAIERAAAATIAGSLQGAIQLLTAGVELVPAGDPRRSRLLLRRARVRTEALDLTRARADVEEALRASGDAPTLAAAQQRLGEIEQRGGNYLRSIELLTDAAARFHSLGDVRGEADSQRLAGMTHVFAGRFTEAEVASRAALAGFEQIGDRLGAAWARQNLAWIAFANDEVVEAEVRIGEALAAFAELGDRGGVAWARGLFAFLRLLQGRFDEARSHAIAELGEAAERGDRWGEAMLTMVIASVDLWEGATESAVVRGEQSMANFVETGEPMGTSQAAALLGRALVKVGRVDEGLRLMREYLVGTGAGFDDGLRMALVLAHLDAGDAVGAGAVFDELRRYHEARRSVGSPESQVAAALVALQMGDLELARTLVDAAVQPSGSLGVAPSALAVASLLAAAEGDREAVEAAATEVLAASRATYIDRTLATVAKGLAAARAGDRAAVAEAFGASADLLAPTQDRVLEAVTSLAEAIALDAVGSPAAAVAHHRSEAELAQIGIFAAGWRRLVATAAGMPVVDPVT